MAALRKGQLSMSDKLAIKGGLHEGKTAEEIASVIKKSPEVVQTYIDKDLDKLAGTIAKAQIQAAQNEVVYVDEKTKDAARRELVKGGLTELDADKVVNKAAQKAANSKRKYRELAPFYTLCVKSMKAGEFMIKRSPGGKKGVTIMTQAASSKSEDSAKKHENIPRSARGNIYRPDTGEIE